MDRLASRELGFPSIRFCICLRTGDTVEELLQEYPSLTQEDILACIENAHN